MHDERFRKLLRSYPVGAIRVLFDVYYNELCAAACRRVRDREVARDIAQETLLLVWKNRKELGGDHAKPIWRYLIRIVRNKSISWHHDQARLQRLDEDFAPFEPSEDPESRIVKSDMVRQVRNVILTFPTRERECLAMKIDQQMTTRQMASSLKVSEKAIERTLTSAYKRLRSWATVHL